MELAAVRTERDRNRNRTGSLYLPATICDSVAAATETDDASGCYAELPELLGLSTP